jgi:photosystem II stability/assembly factor-like uncharacterized protein
MLVALGGIRARAAIEGQRVAAPPHWLGLFGVAIRPSDGAIFAVGAKALLLVSTDHGKSWMQVPVKVRDGTELFQDWDLYSIRFAPDGKAGFIVGEGGVILISTDGGDSWNKVGSGTQKTLLKVSVFDAQDAIAVGDDGTILRTIDGGAHWQSSKSPKEITLFDATYTDKNAVWIAGEFSTVMNSTDGGLSWKVVTGGNTDAFTVGPYFTINFIDAQHVIAGGLAGEIGTSEDGGKTWKTGALPDQVGAYTIAIDPATKKIWAAGTGGRTFAQGADGKWQEASRSTFNDLTDIAFAGNEGVMVGLNGTILLSDNAGEKWQAVQ